MKWNKRAKVTATATSALLFALLLAGCSSDNNNKNSLAVVNDTANQIEVKQGDDSLLNGQDIDADEATTDTTPSEQISSEMIVDDTLYEVTGHYIGAIDSRSIEVEVNGAPVVFQISDAFDYVIRDFAEHSAVTITYTKETIEDGSYTQNLVNSISNAK